MATASKSVDLLGLSSAKDIVKWVLIALAIVVVGFIIWKVAKYYKVKAAKEALDTNKDVIVNGTKINVNLGTVAEAIHEAFHGSIFSEDEDRAIVELMNVPKALVGPLGDVYYKVYGKILKQEFVDYLSAEEFLKVRSQFS